MEREETAGKTEKLLRAEAQRLFTTQLLYDMGPLPQLPHWG